ncbi:MAG TPA: thioredoxin domain-containing protein [Vicinamibacterales bacterium]|nr:thioredoxin domain-containing protein [Vicinamibacterales bacterium]
MSNRLASEHSPYLLQHQDNPVDWYPWGEAAFARARAEDKPIFLSIGYSTCHWCHVMAHESFESAEVADVLNAGFVSIKVDREERPDVDRVYMTFVQATTGSGGWPMSVWLTPSLEPFYGGTYFPPTSRWGRPGFVEILQELQRAWREDREKIEASASSILGRLRMYGQSDGGGSVPGREALSRAVAEFEAAFDRRRGGFGNAPKFPRPSELLFLLREHARTGAEPPLAMVLHTLRAMAIGGMRDHIGGGFHRYSVDGDWRVPHFEKMLYDQAQLVLAYLEAAQATGDRSFADVAVDTLLYVKRDLGHPEGAFYSAEDADSVPPEDAAAPHPHKKEGAFYVWTEGELRAQLGGDAEPFCQRFGVRPDGNAPFDPQEEFTGKNLLYTAKGLDDIATDTGKTVAEVEVALARSRGRLMDLRAARPRPHLDDKVLTAWNGLMIAAFARAGRTVPGSTADGGAGFIADAERAAEFLQRHLWNAGTRTLLRRFRAGDAAVEGYAEDYAYLAFGLIELFEATGDPRWLEWALTLQTRMNELFWDPIEGGWFSTTGHDPSVLLRLKETYDGAEPAASSVAVLNLLALAHLTGDVAASEKIERAIALFGAHLGRAVPMMLSALSTYHAGRPQIVIAGEADAGDTRALLDALRVSYQPTAVVVPAFRQHRSALERVLPWMQPMTPRDGRATAYVCRDFTCQAPVHTAEALVAQLGAPRPQGGS